MAREYFNAYHSYKKTMENLNDAERGRLFMACLEYSETGKTQPLRGNERFVWPSMQSQIDRDVENYERISKSRSESGKKAAKERWKNNKRIQTITNDNKNAKEKEKEKEKEKGQEIKEKDIYPKRKFGEFGHVLMTQDEHVKLLAKYPQAMVDDKIADMDSRIQAKEAKYLKYKDHYATIGNWCRKDAPPEEPKPDYTIKPDTNKQTFREGATWDEILDTLDN